MSPELMTALIGLVGLVGAAFGYWRYFMSQIDSAKREAVGQANKAQDAADSVARELAIHRVHAAETFATKAGMQEQTAQIMRAIEGVGNRIDGVHERLDRVFEARSSTRRTSN